MNERPDDPVSHAGRGNTPYVAGKRYRNRAGVEYVADQSGTLRRLDGGKLSKRERKAAKREAVRELKQRGGR